VLRTALTSLSAEWISGNYFFPLTKHKAYMATNFNSNESSNHAVSLLKAALESGSIKLSGPASTVNSPEAMGEHDAKYLASLINVLADKIKSS
jgi:hypothetical protein